MRPRQSSLGIGSGREGEMRVGDASMRPRQSSLGIRMPATRGPCRQGFNEAEAIKPRNPSRTKTSPAHCALQ